MRFDAFLSKNMGIHSFSYAKLHQERIKNEPHATKGMTSGYINVFPILSWEDIDLEQSLHGSTILG